MAYNRLMGRPLRTHIAMVISISKTVLAGRAIFFGGLGTGRRLSRSALAWSVPGLYCML